MDRETHSEIMIMEISPTSEKLPPLRHPYLLDNQFRDKENQHRNNFKQHHEANSLIEEKSQDVVESPAQEDKSEEERLFLKMLYKEKSQNLSQFWSKLMSM